MTSTLERTASMMTIRKLTITAAMLGVAGTWSVIGSVQAAVSPSAHMKVWDTDSDGTMDMAETNKAAEARFEKLDTDHDGTVSDSELKSKAGIALARLLK